MELTVISFLTFDQLVKLLHITPPWTVAAIAILLLKKLFKALNCRSNDPAAFCFIKSIGRACAAYFLLICCIMKTVSLHHKDRENELGHLLYSFNFRR